MTKSCLGDLEYFLSLNPMALDHREMAGPCKYCAQNDVSGTRLLFPNMRGMIYASKTRQWKISRYADKHCDHHHYHHHQGHLNFSRRNLGNMSQSQRVIWLISKLYKGSKAAKIKGVFDKIVKQTQFLKLAPPSKCVYLVLWHKSVKWTKWHFIITVFSHKRIWCFMW